MQLTLLVSLALSRPFSLSADQLPLEGNEECLMICIEMSLSGLDDRFHRHFSGKEGREEKNGGECMDSTPKTLPLHSVRTSCP